VQVSDPARRLDAATRAAVASLVSLADVVRWGLSLVPPAMIADVVVQDEYNHDVVLPLGDVTLVFDTT
jgi:hypothetical protein